MPKKIYKIIEIIGILIIILLGYKIYPFLKEILQLIFKILVPILISYTIAFLFEPFIEKLEKKNVNRKISIFLLVILILLVIFLLFRFTIPRLIKQLGLVMQLLPEYSNKLTSWLDEINNRISMMFHGFQIDYSYLEDLLNNKMINFTNNFMTILQRSFSYISIALVTPILTIYFLYDYKKIDTFFKTKLLFNHQKIVITCSKIKDAIRQYFKGVIIVMIIFTIASTLTFVLIGIDYSLLFGIIIGITDIIPYIGPYIGGAIVVIATLLIDPKKTLFVLLAIVILQFIESNLLVPKIQSKTMQTHPILVIFSVLLFGELFGIFGMIIAVPLEKIVEIIVYEYFTSKKM